MAKCCGTEASGSAILSAGVDDLNDPNPTVYDEVLPDGKISCISCHQGYDEQHGALVLDNRADGLCFSCHDL